MTRTIMGTVVLGWLTWMAAGCANVQLPREINLGSGSSQEKFDTTDIPVTKTHEEARVELRRAYHRIGQLERDKRRLDRRNQEYKDKYERCKEKYEDLKD